MPLCNDSLSQGSGLGFSLCALAKPLPAPCTTGVGRFTWRPGMGQIPCKIRHATTPKVQFHRKIRHATTPKVQFYRKIRVFGGSADSFRDPGGPRTPPEGLGGPLCSDSVSKQCLGGHLVAILCKAWGGC